MHAVFFDEFVGSYVCIHPRDTDTVAASLDLSEKRGAKQTIEVSYFPILHNQ